MPDQDSLLSAQGRCFPFDDRGSGYGRGEGVAVVALKRVADAVRDGDSIRAVIRGSGLCQDGRTRGITLPNPLAQSDMINETYHRAGLDPRETAYVEAHGTGTAAGDMAEIQALHASYCTQRDTASSLLVGSIKGNIGHLEATSGLAGLIKTILILERGIIPGTAGIQKLKEELRLQERNIKV